VEDEYSLPFKERAYTHYQHAQEYLKRVAALVQEKEVGDIEDYREPLSCDERREITILLSWGGPSDGYKISFDREGEAIAGSYFFADWFAYEEFKLSAAELDSVLTVYPISPIL
jgi:hypothetical protein